MLPNYIKSRGPLGALANSRQNAVAPKRAAFVLMEVWEAVV